jgi:hypothetical protein
MMLSLSDPAWERYTDCYGSGVRVAACLRALEKNPLQGGEHGDGGVWSQLWSRLAHQGDVYLASYAAVPHLVKIGSSIVADERAAIPLDYLHLPTWIEIVRLTAPDAPDIPDGLSTAYHDAITALDDLAIGYALRSSDIDIARVVSAALLVARGDAARAEVVLDWDDDDIAQAQNYLVDGPAFGVN